MYSKRIQGKQQLLIEIINMCLRDKLWKVRGDFMVKEYNDLIEAVDSVKSKKAVIFDMDDLEESSL